MPGSHWSPLVAEHFKVYPEQPPELLHHLGVHICKVLLLLTLPVISTQYFTKYSIAIVKLITNIYEYDLHTARWLLRRSNSASGSVTPASLKAVIRGRSIAGHSK